MRSIILNILFISFIAVVLALTVRGNYGNPNEENINEDGWVEKGPFELSPERGRFALTYSLVEDRSIKFSLPIAKFVTPDLGYKNGEFVSLFAPGVSFISIPGYVVGKAFNASQIGAFSTIAFFALLNTLLVAKVAEKLGANTLSAKIASLIFLFATPAFSYATTMYQHHISVFIILLSLYSVISHRDIISLVIVSFLYSIGISIDYPNAILVAPIMIFALGRLIKRQVVDKKIIQVNFNLLKPFALIAVIPPLLFFLWFNKTSYGSAFRLSGTIPRVVEIEGDKPLFYRASEEKNVSENELGELEKKTAAGFFETRNIINGLYVHIFSLDRGIVFYAPVILLGLMGMFILTKKKNITVFWAIVGVNIIIYSMWGDPWGGWAFGSRYLIPTYAVLSIFTPFVLSKLRKDIFLISIVLVLISYSVLVNSLGALTTIANPPEIEAQSLSEISGREEKFTFERNIDLLLENNSKSFVYNQFLKDSIYVWEYYYLVTLPILLGLILSVSYLTLFQKNVIKFKYWEEKK